MIRLLTTEDGSHTLLNTGLDEPYHSRHGALTESQHVFIRNGLHVLTTAGQVHVHVLEVGFGTGLNALLLFREILKDPGLHIQYCGIEPFPLDADTVEQINYASGEAERELFRLLHAAAPGTWHTPDSRFSFIKLHGQIQDVELPPRGHLVFHDAFGPGKQPELWEKKLLEKVTGWLLPGGIWVSYCAKGQVRRDLITLGLEVKRLPGPPFKRHMLQALKP